MADGHLQRASSLAFRLARRDLKGGLGGLGLSWPCLAVAVAGVAGSPALPRRSIRAIASQGREPDRRRPDADRGTARGSAAPNAPGAGARQDRRAASAPAPCWSRAGRTDAPRADRRRCGVAVGRGARISRAAGGAPRGAEVAIGRAAADRLGLDRGDRLRIGRADFTVSAIIERLPRDAGFALAPPALVDEAGLALTGLVQPGSLTSTSFRVLLKGRRDPEAVGRAFQRQFPDGGWRASDRNDAGSGTRRFVDRLGQMLLLVALSALAIGGLGMASASAAFAASRRPSIAILKLVGAPRATINLMLLVELGLVAGLAILAGLAVGAAAPALVAGIAGPLLPVAPDPSPQWQALGEAALFGLLVTFAASWRASPGRSRPGPAQLLRGDVARPRHYRRANIFGRWWRLALQRRLPFRAQAIRNLRPAGLR